MRRAIPFILLSARAHDPTPAQLPAGYEQEIDRQRTRESGFDEHMVKPVRLDALEAWLRRSQKRRRGKTRSVSDEAAKP